MEEGRGFGCFSCMVLVIIGALAFGLLNRMLLAPLGLFLSDFLTALREILLPVANVLGPILNWGLTFALEEILLWLVILLIVGVLAAIVYIIRGLFWSAFAFIFGLIEDLFK